MNAPLFLTQPQESLIMKLRTVIVALLAAFLIATSADAFSWETVAERVQKSIAHMTLFVETQPEVFEASVCTAFSINQARHIYMTAGHCNGIDMKLDGNPTGLLYRNDANDLMVLQTAAPGKPALKARTKDIKQGLSVAALGYGWGWDQPMLRTGAISIADISPKDFGSRPHTLFDFPFIGGMSGGPIVDSDGHLVSIVQQSNTREVAGMGQTLKVILDATKQYWEE